MHVHDDLGGRGSVFSCSIARVAPEYAAKLVEIVIYNGSTVQCGYITLICHSQVQISHSFGLNLLGVQRTYERESVAILIYTPLFYSRPRIVSACLHTLKLIVPSGRIQGNMVL